MKAALQHYVRNFDKDAFNKRVEAVKAAPKNFGLLCLLWQDVQPVVPAVEGVLGFIDDIDGANAEAAFQAFVTELNQVCWLVSRNKVEAGKETTILVEVCLAWGAVQPFIAKVLQIPGIVNNYPAIIATLSGLSFAMGFVCPVPAPAQTPAA